MLKMAKYAIIINMILSLLFVISDYVLWSIVGGESWSYYGIGKSLGKAGMSYLPEANLGLVK